MNRKLQKIGRLLGPEVAPPERPADKVVVVDGPDLSPLALGICAAAAVVLLVPHPIADRRRKPSEEELLNTRGLAMSMMAFM